MSHQFYAEAIDQVFCLLCLLIDIRLRPRGTKDHLLKASLDGSVIVVGKVIGKSE